MEWDRDFSVTAYIDALDGVVDTVHGLRDDQWSLPTDLPGWSVQDNVSHIIAIEDQLAGRPVPDHVPDYDALPHVRNDFGRHTEIGVDYRRGRRPVELINELHAIVNERKAAISAYPDDPDYLVIGALGKPRPLRLGLPVRTFDVWCHDQDIRRATRQPERLTGPAAALTLERIISSLPTVLAKATLPEPCVVRLVVEAPGPAPAGMTITIAVDHAGSARLVDDDSATSDVALTMPFAAFAHAVTGRGRPIDSELGVAGDASLVDPVLDTLVITP